MFETTPSPRTTAPITKIWLFTLKPDITVTTTAFVDLWTEILAHCASYTSDSNTGGNEQHILYQSEDDPAQLAMITGYPSLELNLEADRVYAAGFMKRMFELVNHQQLFLLYIDIERLPLQSGRVSIVTTDTELSKELSLVGARDCYEPPNKVADSSDQDKKKDFVYVMATADGGDILQETGLKERFVLKRLIGR
ncbi:uncharacterized protein JN550_009894 [Neoarthrinium moseri]|uniref:uncharacterized protein n=1 Tax=Neoarthrinium moseri TaxID=1658444 RepID=UPI001FDBA034|nr:uncharacterized protein JN550_009894 [Neoarthrinium moseri]KAI1863158.1 hypothetical protein JN550_009894 [Neoarthrinium moseri]